MKIYKIKMGGYGYIKFDIPVNRTTWAHSHIIWLHTHAASTLACSTFGSRNNVEFWSKRVAAIYASKLQCPITISIETAEV